MSAIGTMSVNNGTAAVVFDPIMTSPPTYQNLANVAVPSIGKEEIVVVVTRAKGKGTDRVRITCKVPVMEVPSGGTAEGIVAAPAVAYNLLSVHDYYLPGRSTPAQRKIIRSLAMNLSSVPQIVDAIEQLSPPY